MECKSTVKLVVSEIKKVIGKREILKGVSFECSAGEIVTLLGPNGAGKTTTFLITAGFYKPDGGRILIQRDGLEIDVTFFPTYRKSKEGIVYLPQERSFFDDITIYENFVIASELARIGKEKIFEVAEKFGITNLLKRKPPEVSGGERRKAEIARIFLLSPKFLILDEPFAGIDPKSIQSIASLIKELSQLPMGIIVSDHNVRDVLRISSRVYLISDGIILESGSPSDIVKSIKAQSTFFGEEFDI